MPQPDPVTAAGRDAMSVHFGTRLKYWRRTRTRTQAELARDLEVDGSYISKLESSRRSPNPDIARRCDELLDTGGELSGLVSLMEGDRASETATTVPMPLLWSPPPSHGAAEPVGHRPAPTAHTTVTLTRLLESYIEIDASMGGHQIGTAVEQQAQDIIGMHIGATDSVAKALLVVAAKFARLAGWIRFDACDHTGSRFWHDCGQRWALAGGDPALAAELLARQAIVHGTFGDPAGGVALATAAAQLTQDMPPAGVVWALLAQARNHAMTGNAELVSDHLARSRTLLMSLPTPLLTPPGSHSDEYLWHTIAGKARLDLAVAGTEPELHADAAVSLLHKAIVGLPPHHVRDLALARLRIARAYLCLGDPGTAAAELAEAEVLARRCSAARLHSAVAKLRGLLGEPNPAGTSSTRW